MPQFNLDAFCTAVQRHKTTFLYVAPPVIVQLSRGPNVHKYDLSSLRMLTSGAAPLTKELVSFVHRKFDIKVNQAYGLSETSPMTHTLVSGASAKSILRTMLTRSSHGKSGGLPSAPSASSSQT